jgi:hypothetical protein
MNIANRLRLHADDAIKHGGMYYSGDYLSDIADDVKAVTDENAKLRETCERLIQTVRVAESISDCGLLDKRFEGELRDIGIEV